MKAGLQTFDEQGRLVVEITDRIPRIVGQIRTNKLDGKTTVDTSGNFFWQIVRLSGNNIEYIPLITVSNNTITWKYINVPYSYRTDIVIIYGKY